MSVTGLFIPPLFIFPRKRMDKNGRLMIGAPPDSITVPHESGWWNGEIFIMWLQHFNTPVVARSTVVEHECIALCFYESWWSLTHTVLVFLYYEVMNIFSVLVGTKVAAPQRNLAPKVNFYDCRTRDQSRDIFFVSCSQYLFDVCLLPFLYVVVICTIYFKVSSN